jgi:hypothetical protein
MMRQLYSYLLTSTFLFGLTAVVLAGLVGWNVYTYSMREPVVVPPLDAKSVKTADLPDISRLKNGRLPVIGGYRDSIERPLFNSERRPEVQENAAGQVAIQENELSSKWMLTGVVIANENSSAMLKERSGAKKSIKLMQGSKVDGWRLDHVSPYEVELSSAGKTIKLELYEENKDVR